MDTLHLYVVLAVQNWAVRTVEEAEVHVALAKLTSAKICHHNRKRRIPTCVSEKKKNEWVKLDSFILINPIAILVPP